MSTKRRPGTDLNHDNWDEDEEIEEVGVFKKASPDELKQRTIKVAKRHQKIADPAVASSSVFSGFGGFAKIDSSKTNTTGSPFSFLSSEKNVNGNAATSTSSSSGSFGTGFSFGSSTSTAATIDHSSTYYASLKGLNQSVSEWIAKHVASNPLCILTSIFDDYAKFLKEIELKKDKASVTATTSSTTEKSSFSFSSAATATNPTQANLSFGVASKASTDEAPSTSSIAKPAFTLSSNQFGNGATPASSTGFSFGSGAPFTFANVKKPEEHAPVASGSTAVNDDEEPPKNEFTAVVEEDSLYSKRCKVFVKVSNEYVERGVGMLYIKSLEEGTKSQLLVRADTNLGNVLLNIRLSEGIPASRMGKNNVMLICMPTPDSKPPPSTVLVRVKTADEADELLENINKNKK